MCYPETMNFWNEDNLREALPYAKFYNFPENWSGSGIIIWHENFIEDSMVLVRGEKESRGVLLGKSKDILEKCSAIVASNPAPFFKYNRPIIQIPSQKNSDTLIDLARQIRGKFQGKVIDITGSSGKTTTTKMILDIFSSKYKVNSNVENKANTTWGISWNMTCFNPDDDYWVIETSLGGGVARNSAITKPHYALVMNVAPVHLTGDMQLIDVAKEKSRIFHAMKEGGTAIIYRGMEYFDVILEAAKFKNLKIITFGESEDADVQVITNEDGNFFKFDGNTFKLGSEQIGKHILLDMAATLAVVKEEKFDIEEALNILRNFSALSGRGETFTSKLDDNRTITVVDESYNANPLSMNMAIKAFTEKYQDSNRVLILGDMAECGSNVVEYHRNIAQIVDYCKPKKVFLCGKEIRALFEDIKNSFECFYYEDLNALNKNLFNHIDDGDVILLKSSHSTKLHKIVTDLKQYQL